MMGLKKGEIMKVDREIQMGLSRLRAKGTYSEVELKNFAEKHGKTSNYWFSLALDLGDDNWMKPDILCLMISLSIIKNPQKRAALKHVISLAAKNHERDSRTAYLKEEAERHDPDDPHDFGMRRTSAQLELTKLSTNLSESGDLAMSLYEAVSNYLANYQSKSDESDCFVATATYGSPNHERVLLLRLFRDDVLTNYRIGRLFISAYWIVGPRLARLINYYPVSKKAIAPMLGGIARCVKKV